MNELDFLLRNPPPASQLSWHPAKRLHEKLRCVHWESRSSFFLITGRHKWEDAEETAFIERSSEMAIFYRGQQKWHPSTHSSAKSPPCEWCLCNRTPATFRLVAQPRTFKEGRRNRKANRVHSERGWWDEIFQTFVNLCEQFLLLTIEAVPHPHPTLPSREICYLLSNFKSH